MCAFLSACRHPLMIDSSFPNIFSLEYYCLIAFHPLPHHGAAPVQCHSMFLSYFINHQISSMPPWSLCPLGGSQKASERQELNPKSIISFQKVLIQAALATFRDLLLSTGCQALKAWSKWPVSACELQAVVLQHMFGNVRNVLPASALQRELCILFLVSHVISWLIGQGILWHAVTCGDQSTQKYKHRCGPDADWRKHMKLAVCDHPIKQAQTCTNTETIPKQHQKHPQTVSTTLLVDLCRIMFYMCLSFNVAHICRNMLVTCCNTL